MCVLADVIIKTQTIKNLNIANNQMDDKSSIAIAYGMMFTQTINYIDVSGNPIGKFGMSLLLQAQCQNNDVQF